MMAINPPVLVPPIKSKWSHGFGEGNVSLLRPISSIISRKIKRVDSPRTPPPSSERILGICCILSVISYGESAKISWTEIPFESATSADIMRALAGILRTAYVTDGQTQY